MAEKKAMEEVKRQHALKKGVVEIQKKSLAKSLSELNSFNDL